MHIKFEKAGGFAGIFMQGALSDPEIPDELKQTIHEHFEQLEQEEERENPMLVDSEMYTVEIEAGDKGKCAFTTTDPSSVRNKVARQIVRVYVRREIERRMEEEE